MCVAIITLQLAMITLCRWTYHMPPSLWAHCVLLSLSNCYEARHPRCGHHVGGLPSPRLPQLQNKARAKGMCCCYGEMMMTSLLCCAAEYSAFSILFLFKCFLSLPPPPPPPPNGYGIHIWHFHIVCNVSRHH